MLFVLVIDTLNRLLAKATERGILRRLAARHLLTSVSLYADDVIIFCHPDRSELLTVRRLLSFFGQASGLQTNFAKCSVSPIGCTEDVAAEAAVAMGCTMAPFPVKYLGIPLGIRKPSAEAFGPLVDKIADRLPPWKAGMMSKSGRRTLIKSVLSAIPLHQILVLGLYRKVQKRVEKILRGFLWSGRAEARSGHCHVSWSKVCMPLCYRGLGIPDFSRLAVSLRVRWMWRMRTDSLRPWRGLDLQFSHLERRFFLPPP